MILEHKREKIFMLCTHILNEAELLCDIISIMVRGNIYTVGTPQYLTQKFGTEYKIDIMLDDASEESECKVNEFFKLKLPYAKLTIGCPASRIYSVPDSCIQLADLFILLEDGKEQVTNYYTCSTSSLESSWKLFVFLNSNTRRARVLVIRIKLNCHQMWTIFI